MQGNSISHAAGCLGCCCSSHRSQREALAETLDMEAVEQLAATVADCGRLQPLEIELSAAMGDDGPDAASFHMAHIASVVSRSFILN